MHRLLTATTLLLVLLVSLSGAAVYLNRQFSSTIVASLVVENESEFIDFLRGGEPAFALIHRIASGAVLLAAIGLAISAACRRPLLDAVDRRAPAMLVVALAGAVATAAATFWAIPLAPSQPSLVLHCFAIPGAATMILIVLLARDKVRRTEPGRLEAPGTSAGNLEPGFLFAAIVSGMLALSSLEVAYTLAVAPATFGGASEVLGFIAISLGMASLAGIVTFAIALALAAIMLALFNRLRVRRGSQAFALAAIGTVAFDAALFALLYGFEDLRFIQLYVAVDFIVAIVSILAFYPLATGLRSILDREQTRKEALDGPDLLAALSEAAASVFLYPLAAARRRPAGRTAAAGVLFLLSAGLFALDMLAFHTYGWYIHVVLSALLAIFFLMFWLLASGALVRRMPPAVLALPAIALAALPFALIDASANLKYVACNRTEILRTEVLLIQRLLDLDRDGFSAVLGGGDPDDADPRVNPVRGHFKGFAGPDGGVEPPRPRPGELLEVPWSDAMDVIVFCIDAMRADVMGCYGAAPSFTPSIDRFAAESILYERAYAAGPATPISQYSMLSGRYARRLIWQSVPPDNYLSLFYGRGFANIAAQGLLLDERNFRLVPGAAKLDLPLLPVTDYFNASREQYDDLVAFLSGRDPAKRTFLWVQFLDPHFGFVHHPEVGPRGISPRDGYLNEVLYTDRYVGKSIEYLKGSGLWDRALVVVTADHGTELFDHGKYYHGQELYEESVRVPLIIHVPACFAGARPDRQPRRVRVDVSTIALLSTLFAWTTGSFETREAGAGPLPLFDGDGSEGPGDIYMVSAYEDKFAVVSGRMKMIYDRALETYQVYELDRDPQERRNICSEEHRTLREKLLGFISRHQGTYPRECPLDFR